MPRLSMNSLAVFALLCAAACSPRGPRTVSDVPQPLGQVHFPVSCSPTVAQEFDRAVTLLHHMTYPQAREAFRAVATIDSGCAMAYWGVAMTLFQPLWPTRPGLGELERGWAAVQKAKSLAVPTERERLFLSAADAFFDEPKSADYWSRIRRWEQAMEKVHAAFPDDPEAAAFHALALLAVARSAEGSPAHNERAAEMLLRIHRLNPRHPGAVHYTIHANDVNGRESESPEIIRGYDAIAPRNPHALHMPTHIFVRLGDWDRTIEGNLRAADAALAHPAGDRGQYVWDEFPHAIEYLVYAYLQKGDDEAAKAQIARLRETVGLEPTFKTAFHLASTASRYALEQRAWSDAAALVPRHPPTLEWDRFPWAEAVTWFARGLGAANTHQGAEARRARSRLADLESAAQTAGEHLFARQIAILRLAVSASIAHDSGAAETAAQLMREAAELEAVTPKDPVTPAPTLPAYELLGDLLMQHGRPQDALKAYEHSLALYPRRFATLLGAARAARAIDDVPRATAFYQQLRDVAARDSKRTGLKEASDYLAARAHSAWRRPTSAAPARMH